MPIRTGRFKLGASATQVVIEGRKSGLFYRIYNSGEDNQPLTVGSNTVPAMCSIDVTVKTALSVAAGADGGKGIYVALGGMDPEVRSGRIKYAGPIAKQVVVSPDGGPNKAVYRIFNSGDTSFQIFRKNTSIVTLPPDGSIDVMIENTPNQEISVQPQNMNEVIEVIYDYLGDY